jgi:hypothetical protein
MKSNVLEDGRQDEKKDLENMLKVEDVYVGLNTNVHQGLHGFVVWLLVSVRPLVMIQS